MTGSLRPWFDDVEFSQSAFQAHDSDPIEYYPKTDTVGVTKTWQAIIDLPVHLKYRCAVAPAAMPYREVSDIQLSVACASAGPAALPLFFVRGLIVEVDGRVSHARRTCADPRALLDLSPGRHAVIVHFQPGRPSPKAFSMGRRILPLRIAR